MEKFTKMEEIENIKSLYPMPKDVLHNCFDVLAQKLKQKDLKLTPQYDLVEQQRSSTWMSTYNLKWPQVIKFSETAGTKQEASHKAALAALLWLKQNKKITKGGSPIINDKKEVSAPKTEPKTILHNFYVSVAKRQKSHTLLLEAPEFIFKNTMYLCIYQVFWPKPLKFPGSGFSKKESSNQAALAAIQWLKGNNYMDEFHKPIYENVVKNGLKLNISNHVQVYSTSSKTDINENTIAVNINANNQIDPNEIENVKSQYPMPKNVLHKCFEALSQKLKQKDLKLTPQYVLVKQHRSSTWMATYNLKWPQVIKFSETAGTKQEASHKAALAALLWLKQNKKITNGGSPIINDKKEVSKVINETYVTPTVSTTLLQEFTASENSSRCTPPLQFDLDYSASSVKIAPKHILYNFYDSVASRQKSLTLLLETPKFIHKNAFTFSCIYQVFWPKSLRFSGSGFSKKESSSQAALAAIQWLKDNHYMDQFHKPIYRNAVQNRLKLNIKNEVRVYSTSSKTDINENTISVDINANNETLYPMPKNVLHKCFNDLAQKLKQKDLKLTPQYVLVEQQRNSTWMSTYNLKWPQVIKFSETANTKQAASHKAALAALLWLKQNKKITKDGTPIIYDKKEVSKAIKQTYPVLLLNQDVETEMHNIEVVYKNNLVTKLAADLDKYSDDGQEKTMGELAEKCPDTKTNQQIFRDLQFYLAREPVQLPISQYKDDLINVLRNNRVLIVKGEPGCGKSTRVPQYVLEAWAKEDHTHAKPCKIIVTQPRRIAAISLAEHVANEREESVGYTVGYRVRLNSNFNNRTGHIMYCTTGILLRRLQFDPKLSDCSHVIVDEAHERTVDTDLLMNLLRYALDLNPYLKVLIMSATIDAKLFQDYFNDAPVLHIPGFTYPVKQTFLKENNLPKTYSMCMGEHPTVIPEDVVKTINHIHKEKPDGAMLCFLPGWDEIMKVKKLIREGNDMVVLCLHSQLEMSEQRRIFHRLPPGIRKVILSTNIAEASLTIDDVDYVVDTGIHKEERFDVEKGVKCLDNHWISQASAIQRKGRAGRCQPGECFHMYPKSKYTELPEYSVPEILRTSLTKIVLDSKVYSNNMNAVEFLEELVCPPETNAVQKAVEELRELELIDEDENLTPLGRILSDFQLAPKLSKAIVNAVIFKCVTPIIDIVTLYSAESAVFAKGLIDKEGIKTVMQSFSNTSDHLAFMKLFEQWLAMVEDGYDLDAKRFCTKSGLVDYKLETLRKLREIHFKYLNGLSFDVLPPHDDLSDNDEIVKAVLLSGVGTVLQHRTWDIAKGRMKKANVFITRNNHKATITSESVNYKKSKFSSDFLLYINETVSNLRHTTLVRETSQILPLAVLLFRSGHLVTEEITKDNFTDKLQSSDQVLLKLDGTAIKFVCDRQQAVAVKQCKDILCAVSQYYIYQLTKGKQRNDLVNQCWQQILNSLNNIFK